MIFTEQTIGQLKTASDVKYALNDSSYFFTRKTMRFFGDKMTSFGVRTINGKRYLYRKPSARVNVFGTWKQAGKDFFGCWEIVPKNKYVDLIPVIGSEKDAVYNSL
jgi:hypothetical protein